jgi:hypothetical protein
MDYAHLDQSRLDLVAEGQYGPLSQQNRLRWWTMSPNHVLSHGRLGDLDAEHKQLAVDARCTPQRVLSTDAPNKAPDIGRHSGSAHLPT